MARFVTPIAHSTTVSATSIADGSLFLRAFDRAFGVTVEDWHTSKTKGRIERLCLINEIPRGEQAVRLVGWMALSAIVTRVVITGFDGLLNESAGLGWFAALPLTVACIFRPGSVLVAWRRWRVRASSGATGSTGRRVDALSSNRDDIWREPPDGPHPTQALRPR